MKRIIESLKAWIIRSNETLIELIIGILVVNVCIVIPGSIISGSVLTFCLGELLGTVYAVFTVIHMTVTIENMLDLPEDESSKYAKRGYAVRLVVTIAVMIIGLKLSIFHFVGVFLGMISIKLSVWIRPLVHKFTARNLGKGR